MIIRALLVFATARPGLFVAHVPVLLNGNRDSPYRTLTLKGELLAPNITFDPECLRLTPVPLGTQVSVNFNIIARGYRRYVYTINLFFLLTSVLYLGIFSGVFYQYLGNCAPTPPLTQQVITS